MTVRPADRLRGQIQVPGDKSMSHRYAMLAALADGTSRIAGYAPGADCVSTLTCLEALGVAVRRTSAAAVEIDGRGAAGLARPAAPLDAGNSGTTMRLLAGILAGQPFEAVIVGDASLTRRPMRRVIDPLSQMGAQVTAAAGDRPPLTIRGGALRAIDYTMPVASAQVKSAILLAALHADGTSIVREPVSTRDHTERALAAFGVDIDTAVRTVTLRGAQRPRGGLTLHVPGDPSSAAFFGIAAAAVPGSDVRIAGVGLNPTRTAWVAILRRAGARIEVETEGEAAGEPYGSIRIRHDTVRPLRIGAEDVPGLIDELPALAAMATHGGRLTVTGASELRFKESDRISALVAGLRALGADAEELPDGFLVHGAAHIRGGAADAAGDHRLAMAFAIAALGARNACEIRGAEAVAVSYPGFFPALESLRA